MQVGSKIALGGALCMAAALIAHGPLGLGGQFARDHARPTDSAEAQTEAGQAASSACTSAQANAADGRDVQFRSGSAYLSPASLRIVRDVALAAKACPGASVRLAGSDVGPMNQERIRRVREALVAAGTPDTAIRTVPGNPSGDRRISLRIETGAR